MCCGPRVATSLVLRAKGSFQLGVEVAGVVATTFFSLIMEEKEDEDAKCLVHLDTRKLKIYQSTNYKCEQSYDKCCY